MTETTVTNEKLTKENISKWLIDHLEMKLQIEPAEIDADKEFDQLGIDSAETMKLVGELEDHVGRTLSPSVVYQHPTIDSLSDYLSRPPADSQAP